MSIRDIHLLKATLQSHIGVIVRFGARREALQRLRQPDAPVVQHRRQHGAAIRALGNLEHGTMHVQGIDGPRAHFAQPVIVLQCAHRLARCRARPVGRDGVVAARRAAGASHEDTGVVVDRRYDEVFG